jgi:hypothetical protein
MAMFDHDDAKVVEILPPPHQPDNRSECDNGRVSRAWQTDVSSYRPS